MHFFVFVLLTVFVSVQAFYISKLDFNAKLCGIEASSNPIHRNPWTVFLEYYNNENKRIYLRCAGSLISSRHVVTAAHCVKGKNFKRLIARLGEYDLFTSLDCADGVCADPPERINVARTHVLSTYDGKEHDIAVLELKHDAPYTDFIRPACLPTWRTLTDVTLTASGWGELAELNTHTYSHLKKTIPLPIWPEDKCRKAYRHTLPQNIICAGGENGIDTCRGDSGGPLVVKTGTLGGRMELIGVTSAGPGHCGTEGVPGLYTSVYDYLDFIKIFTVGKTYPESIDINLR